MKSQDAYADITPYWSKLQDIRRVQPETVFLGSSRTFRHVDPVRLDSVQGSRSRSYNFGILGSRALETHFRADHLLTMDLPIRRMVLELGPIALRVPERTERTRRTHHYHDARRAALGSRVALASDEPWMERVRSIAARWRYWTMNTFLVGWGRAWANSVMTERDWRGDEETVGRRGYVPLRQGGPDQRSAEERRARRTRFLSPEGQAAFTRKRAALRDRSSVTPTERDRVTAEVWLGLAERARERGVEVVFVEQVGEGQSMGVTRLVREALGEEAVIVLNDPRRYPELFDRDAWFDGDHLGPGLAARATDLLAQELPSLDG